MAFPILTGPSLDYQMAGIQKREAGMGFIAVLRNPKALGLWKNRSGRHRLQETLSEKVEVKLQAKCSFFSVFFF